MKTWKTIAKIVAALAAVAGIVYVVATYGDKIVAWAKKLVGSICGCCDCCDCTCECEDDCDACPCEDDCDTCCCGCTAELSVAPRDTMSECHKVEGSCVCRK